MKSVECRQCGNSSWHCPSGDHVKTPGRIHTGLGAKSDYDWDCPNCRGTGRIEVSWLDRLCEYIYKRGRRVNRKLHPPSY